jgi:hypothetical protein
MELSADKSAFDSALLSFFSRALRRDSAGALGTFAQFHAFGTEKNKFDGKKVTRKSGLKKKVRPPLP